MAHHRQATFSRGSEVLDHSIRFLSEILDVMEQIRDDGPPERAALLLDSVLVDQRNLLGSLERLREEGSERMLDSFAQFTVELPEDAGAPERPLTALGLTQWLVPLNASLGDLFKQLAERADTPEAAELFEGVAEQVDAHDRRLSKEYQRLEDL
jgi:hypothetical protein